MQSATITTSRGTEIKRKETHELYSPRINCSRGSDHIFCLGVFDRGMVIPEGFRTFSIALSNIGLTDEVHALGYGGNSGSVASRRGALRRLVLWHFWGCEGITIRTAHGSVCRLHSLYFQPCYDEHGYEARAGNRN